MSTEQMAPTPILKPCMVCNGAVRVFSKGVECPNCGLSLTRLEGYEKAVELWNSATERAARATAEARWAEWKKAALKTGLWNAGLDATTVGDYLHHQTSAATALIDRAESAEAQLQIAREDSKRLREDLRTVTRDRNEWREHAQAETECPNCKSAEAQLQIAGRRLSWAINYPEHFKEIVWRAADTLAAIDAALAQITDPPSQSFGGAGGKEKK